MKKKKVIIYGAGVNCSIFFRFAELKDICIEAIADKYQAGKKYQNWDIIPPEKIAEYDYEEIFVLVSKAEAVIRFLADELHIDKNKIVDPDEINRRYMLQDIEKNRYVMLTDAQDYSNYPYEKLNDRADFTMQGTLYQQGKWEIPKQKIDVEHVFIVRDHCYGKFKKEGLLDYLRAVYRNSKWVLLISDMCDGEFGRKAAYGEDYVSNAKREFDIVITYHPEEAKKYGLKYKELVFPKNNRTAETEYDVFFVGHAKNRLDLIHRIYLWLVSHGVTCRFWITNTDEKDQISGEGILYNQRLSYDEVLDEISKCRCILEVCQKGDITTYRYAEAVTSNKKLLVNDASCIERKYYDEKFIRCFKTEEDIDCGWICDGCKVDYHYDEDFSEDLLQYIEREMKCLETKNL